MNFIFYAAFFLVFFPPLTGCREEEEKANTKNENPAEGNNSDGTVGPSAFTCHQEGRINPWVYCNEQGKLIYALTSTGDRITDFSSAGYGGGGPLWPIAKNTTSVSPSGGDDTSYIQAAINLVGAQPQDENGIRGRVLLSPGTFLLAGSLAINQSGVILEGSGTVGNNVTRLKVSGSGRNLINVSGIAGPKSLMPSMQQVGTSGSGAIKFQVQSTQGFQVGNPVVVNSTRNLSWIEAVWAPSSYPPTRDGNLQTAWGSQLSLKTLRAITEIEENESITLDAPLGFSTPDPSYMTADRTTFSLADVSTLLSQVGISHLILEANFVPGPITGPLFTGIVMKNLQDAWIDDVVIIDCGFIGVLIDTDTRRITVQDVRTSRTGVQTGSAKAFDITYNGTQTLIQGCQLIGEQIFFIASESQRTIGPNVAMNIYAKGLGAIEPHQRFSTASLYDNIFVPQGAINLINRYTYGTGQGWPMAYGVVFNSEAGTDDPNATYGGFPIGIAIEQPPLAGNWGIGLIGRLTARDLDKKSSWIDFTPSSVGIASLYVEQLRAKDQAEKLQSIMGPWSIKYTEKDLCLLPSVLDAQGGLVAFETCSDSNRIGPKTWDITSRGAIRLANTSLCLDASNLMLAGSQLELKNCSDEESQLWSILDRSGQGSIISMKSNNKCLKPTTSLQGFTLDSCADNDLIWSLVPEVMISK